jgi:hypothetical protein
MHGVFFSRSPAFVPLPHGTVVGLPFLVNGDPRLHAGVHRGCALVRTVQAHGASRQWPCIRATAIRHCNRGTAGTLQPPAEQSRLLQCCPSWPRLRPLALLTLYLLR